MTIKKLMLSKYRGKNSKDVYFLLKKKTYICNSPSLSLEDKNKLSFDLVHNNSL